MRIQKRKHPFYVIAAAGVISVKNFKKANNRITI